MVADQLFGSFCLDSRRKTLEGKRGNTDERDALTRVQA